MRVGAWGDGLGKVVEEKVKGRTADGWGEKADNSKVKTSEKHRGFFKVLVLICNPLTSL